MRHAENELIMINDLRQEPFDPILAYKPQHRRIPEYASLPDNAFMLAIQTEWQKELYEKYASFILCMDSTHSTNAYQFKVTRGKKFSVKIECK